VIKIVPRLQLVVTKTPSSPSVSAASTVITYAIVVTNNGNVPLSSISVADPLASVSCATSGTSTIGNLAVGASENCSAQYTVLQSSFDSAATAINNTATASTTYAGSPVSAAGSAVVSLLRNPQLSILKSANTSGPVNANGGIVYTYRVQNTGNVTINGVTVSDIHNGTGTPPSPGSEAIFNDAAPLGDSTDTTTNGSWDTLRPGDTIRFTASYLVNQQDIDTLQ
jgi:uncharacterized repeat protein (TIGR01451 family)